MSHLSRRQLLAGGLAAMAAPNLRIADDLVQAGPRKAPLAISSGNGLRATEIAMEELKKGADTLDAAVAGVNVVELDPNDTSVGYGGLPNERGVVELDASVMHGPSMRAGAVASLQGIKTPSSVARLVMRHTDHVMLVGPGALEFAKLFGFQEENLLTDRARRAWLQWKTRLNKNDNWLDDEQIGEEFPNATGTISCLTLNSAGDMSGVTTTSGLAWKIPGRVGDSPIIGAGLYVDNEVGACGSTGRGEACILVGGSRIVVENMRRGMSPREAALDVLERVCKQTKAARLLAAPGRPNFNLNFYCLNKNGDYAGAAIYRGPRFAVNDGERNRLETSAYLYESATA
ncbi:MAG: N(4)-(beta-N-acetylglucosaminyl)-L-asparaginase [Fimbriimonadaceae bacterium]